MTCKYIQLNHLLASIEHGKPDVYEKQEKRYEPDIQGFSRKKLREIVSRLPVIEYSPPRYGRWIFNKDGSGTCSECNYHNNNAWFILDDWVNFCERCGADMREYVGKDADGNLIKNPRLRNE